MESTSNNNLTLKILFVVLLLALLGELAYVLTVNKKGASVSSTPTGVVTPAISIISPAELLTAPVQEKIKGKIMKINAYDITPNAKIKFLFAMSDDTGKPQIFYFNENEIKYLKVIDSTGNNISYKDLKIDQNIEFIQEYGLKEKPYFNLEIKITD